MDDDTTDTPDGSPATAASATATPADAGDEAAEALAEMRARLDEAAADIDRLADALEERTQALDEVETIADGAAWAPAAAALVVVRGDRRVRALSPAAAELLGVDVVARGAGAVAAWCPTRSWPSSARTWAARATPARPRTNPTAAAAGQVVAAGWTVEVTPLPGGGAVLVLGEK